MKPEILAHLEAYYTNRLGFLRDKKRQIQESAYQESCVESFWENRGKLKILKELISIEESLVVRDSEVKEAKP